MYGEHPNPPQRPVMTSPVKVEGKPLIKISLFHGGHCYIDPEKVIAITVPNESGVVAIELEYGVSLEVLGSIDKVACLIMRIPYNEPKI